MPKTTNFVPAFLLAFIALGGPLWAADFSFFATLRAGRPAGGDWEMGLGSSTSASDSTASFQWGNGDPHWRSGNLPQNFEIGYLATTQSAYVTVWNSSGQPQTVQFVNSGVPLGSQAIWSFPAANFFASASSTSQPSSINVENLRLSSGVQVLSGSLPASIGASQPAPQVNSLNAPLVINPAANGGNWFISGTIRFSGITSTGGSARGSSLQFMLRATGTDTPEIASGISAGLGLALAGLAGLVRRAR